MKLWYEPCNDSYTLICMAISFYSEEYLLRLSENFKKLVIETGGSIESNFVTNFGCMLVSRSCVTSEATFLFDSVNINCSSPAYERFAEFNKRLPNLGFSDKKETGLEYQNRHPEFLKNIDLYKHSSATFLLAGITLEAAFYLSDFGAEITKVIPSNNEQMLDPFYRIHGSLDDKKEYKNYLSRVINPSSFNLPVEDRNIMLPGCKTLALVFTCSIKEFDQMFKQMSYFNSTELKQICERMCDSLHHSFPNAIKTCGEYHVH